jgi:ABC-type nickel/cobalt efflux system permease component RcnA
MVPTLPAVVGIGLVLGFRHAFEPDHLAAVSTLATRQGSVFAACRLGLAWALGHTASVGAVVLAIIVAGVHFPASLWPAADVVVGLLLVGLGGSVIYRYARGRWHLHAHRHESEEGTHLHLHSHSLGHSHAHGHPAADVRRSLGFGLLHGLAGSAAILVLLVASAPTRGAQVAYFSAFGAGTLLGMLAVSATLALVIRVASRRGERWAQVLHLTSAAASLVVGVLLAARTIGQL